MFFNYAEEAEKRREQRRRYIEAGLDPPSSSGGSSSARETGGAGSGSTSSTRYAQSFASPGLTGSVASSSTRRAPSVVAWESRTDGNTGSSAKSNGRSGSIVSMRRPAWPPSHAEIVADARSDQRAGGGHSFFETDADIITGPKIPMWYRGPLLLAGKLELPQPLTKVHSAKAFKSTSGIPDSYNGMMRSGYDGASEDVGVGVRAARDRARSVSWIPASVDDDSSVTGTWVSDDDRSIGGEWRRTYGEGLLNGVPDRRAALLKGSMGDKEGGTYQTEIRYTEQEQHAIRQVMARLTNGEDGHLFPGWEALTRQDWVRFVCLPVRRALERMDDYRASGLDLRQRFSFETGISTLRRWVIAHQHDEMDDTARTAKFKDGGGAEARSRRNTPSPSRARARSAPAAEVPTATKRRRRPNLSLPAPRGQYSPDSASRSRGGTDTSVDSSPERQTPTDDGSRRLSLPLMGRRASGNVFEGARLRQSAGEVGDAGNVGGGVAEQDSDEAAWYLNGRGFSTGPESSFLQGGRRGGDTSTSIPDGEAEDVPENDREVPENTDIAGVDNKSGMGRGGGRHGRPETTSDDHQNRDRRVSTPSNVGGGVNARERTPEASVSSCVHGVGSSGGGPGVDEDKWALTSDSSGSDRHCDLHRESFVYDGNEAISIPNKSLSPVVVPFGDGMGSRGRQQDLNRPHNGDDNDHYHGHAAVVLTDVPMTTTNGGERAVNGDGDDDRSSSCSSSTHSRYTSNTPSITSSISYSISYSSSSTWVTGSAISNYTRSDIGLGRSSSTVAPLSPASHAGALASTATAAQSSAQPAAAKPTIAAREDNIDNLYRSRRSGEQRSRDSEGRVHGLLTPQSSGAFSKAESAVGLVGIRRTVHGGGASRGGDGHSEQDYPWLRGQLAAAAPDRHGHDGSDNFVGDDNTNTKDPISTEALPSTIGAAEAQTAGLSTKALTSVLSTAPSRGAAAVNDDNLARDIDRDRRPVPVGRRQAGASAGPSTPERSAAAGSISAAPEAAGQAAAEQEDGTRQPFSRLLAVFASPARWFETSHSKDSEQSVAEIKTPDEITCDNGGQGSEDRKTGLPPPPKPGPLRHSHQSSPASLPIASCNNKSSSRSAQGNDANTVACATKTDDGGATPTRIRVVSSSDAHDEEKNGRSNGSASALPEEHRQEEDDEPQICTQRSFSERSVRVTASAIPPRPPLLSPTRRRRSEPSLVAAQATAFTREIPAENFRLSGSPSFTYPGGSAKGAPSLGRPSPECGPAWMGFGVGSTGWANSSRRGSGSWKWGNYKRTGSFGEGGTGSGCKKIGPRISNEPDGLVAVDTDGSSACVRSSSGFTSSLSVMMLRAGELLGSAESRDRAAGEAVGREDNAPTNTDVTGTVAPRAGDDDDRDDEVGDTEETRESGGLFKERMPPSYLERVLFTLSDPNNRYRYVHLVLWLAVTVLMALDRIFWNLWPRQDIGFCAPSCGEDVICPTDPYSGCLAKGPWTVQAYDAVARISGRVIISTTNLILATLCHGTWSHLAETRPLRGFLRGWRADNGRLRYVGMFVMGVAVMAHVYAPLLPSLFSGFDNEVMAATGCTWPLQILPMEPVHRFNMESEVATWIPDELISLSWVTSIVALLTFLLLRFRRYTLPFLRENPALLQWLQAVVGVVLLVEIFRRRQHPHAWLLNGPMVLWCAVDTIYTRFFYRVNRAVAVTRVALGADHELLLWNKRRRRQGSFRRGSAASASVAPFSEGRKIGAVCRIKPCGSAERINGNACTVVVFSPCCLSASAGIADRDGGGTRVSGRGLSGGGARRKLGKQALGVADSKVFDGSVDGDVLDRDGDLGSGDNSDSIDESAIMYDGDKNSCTRSDISSVGKASATCKTTVTDELSPRGCSMSRLKNVVGDSPIASDSNWTLSDFNPDEKNYPEKSYPGRSFEAGPAAEELETPVGKYFTTTISPERTTVPTPREDMHDLPALSRLGPTPLLPFSSKAKMRLGLRASRWLTAGSFRTPSSLEHKHGAANIVAATDHARSNEQNDQRDEQTGDRNDHSETPTNESSTAQFVPPPVHPERLPHPFRRDSSKDERRARLVRAASSGSYTPNPRRFGTPDSKRLGTLNSKVGGTPRSRGSGTPSLSGRRTPHSKSRVASRSDGWRTPYSRDRGTSCPRGGGIPYSRDDTPRSKGGGTSPSNAESTTTWDDDVASGRSTANFFDRSKDENTSASLTSSNLESKRARGRPRIRGGSGNGRQDAGGVDSARSASNGKRRGSGVGGSTTSEVTLSNRGDETDDSETTDDGGDVVAAAAEEEARFHAPVAERGGDRDRGDGFQQQPQGWDASRAGFSKRQDADGAQTRQQHLHQERPYGGGHDEEKTNGRSGAPPRSSSAAQQIRNRRMAAIASGSDGQGEVEHESREFVGETDDGVTSSPAAAARLRQLRARLISGHQARTRRGGNNPSGADAYLGVDDAGGKGLVAVGLGDDARLWASLGQEARMLFVDASAELDHVAVTVDYRDSPETGNGKDDYLGPGRTFTRTARMTGREYILGVETQQRRHILKQRAIGRDDSLSASFSFSCPPSSAGGAGWREGEGEEMFGSDPKFSSDMRWLDRVRGDDDNSNNKEAPGATGGGDIEQGGIFPFGGGLGFVPGSDFATVAGGGVGAGRGERGETWDCMAIVSRRTPHMGGKAVGARGGGMLNDGPGSRGSKGKGRRNSWWGLSGARVQGPRRDKHHGHLSSAMSMALTETNSSVADTSRECTKGSISGYTSMELEDVAGGVTVSGGGIEGRIDAYGPFGSSLGRLADFPHVPPLLVIATGAGAGLLLGFSAHITSSSRTMAANRSDNENNNNNDNDRSGNDQVRQDIPVHVTVCFASNSQPLLRFVTNALLAKKAPGVRVMTAILERGAEDDDEICHSRGKAAVWAAEGEKGPKGGGGKTSSVRAPVPFGDRYVERPILGRLDVETLISQASPKTEVYFCGERGYGSEIRRACARVCLKYSGTYVD